jgi:hypothetical protein
MYVHTGIYTYIPSFIIVFRVLVTFFVSLRPMMGIMAILLYVKEKQSMDLVCIYAQLLRLRAGERYGPAVTLLPLDPLTGALHVGQQRVFVPTRCVRLALRILCRLRPQQLDVVKFAKAVALQSLGYIPSWLERRYSAVRGEIVSAAKTGKTRQPFSDAHKARLRQSAKSRANRIKELEDTVERLRAQLATLSLKS